MKKLLLIACLLGAVGPVKAMDHEILYQKDGVVIIQKDINEFGLGTMTEGRFNELHSTIVALVPELQGYGYRYYSMAVDCAPDRLRTFSNQMSTKFANLKTQGQQPAALIPPLPSAPKASSSSASRSASSSPTASVAPQPAAAPAPHSTPAPQPAAATRVAVKPATVASQPAPIPVKSTVIIDTKYLVGVACAVLVVWIAYQWYEAWSEDTDDEGKNN